MKRATATSFLVLASLILLTGLLVGCSGWTHHTVNAYELYEESLQYSLGDHNVLEVREERRCGGIGTGSTFYVWDIQYTRHTGETAIFELDNVLPLDHQLLHHAAAQSVIDIHRTLTSTYFSKEEIDKSDDASARIQIRPLISNISDTLDSAEGIIKLYSATPTPQELVRYWGVSYTVSLSIDEVEYAASETERLKAFTQALAAYLQQAEIDIRFNVTQDDDLSFEGTYHKQADAFETITNKEKRVVWGALSRSQWQIIHDVATDYFLEEELTTPSSLAPVRVLINHSAVFRETADFRLFEEISEKTSIELDSVTPSELVAYWGVTYSVAVTVTDYEKHEEAFESLLSLIEALAIYLEQDEIVFSFLVNIADVRDSLSYRGVYHRQTGVFKFSDY